MKRLATIALALLMLFSAVSCDGNKGGSESKTEASTIQSENETDKDTVTDNVSESDETESKAEAEDTTVSETESKDETDGTTETETKMETESETESASKGETDGATETETESKTESETETEEEYPDASVKVISPAHKATVVLANENVYNWWKDYDWKTTDTTPFYQHKDIYRPVPVVFEWSAPEGAVYYAVYLSKNKDMTSCESIIVNKNSFSLDNLFVGTDYYWQIDAVYADKTVRSPIYRFTTADSPRALNIEGVSNTRDIGGLAAIDGYRIKQGMIYRGGKLNEMTEAGKTYFRNEIGVKTDFDLRSNGEGGAGAKSPLGDDINYINISGKYYASQISSAEDKAVIAQEIRVFANKDNYPIYVHCSLGRDRTGTIIMIIEGLLGVSKNDIVMDYELSFFSVTGTLDNANVPTMQNNIVATYNYINNNYKGGDFSEKVENYLLSTGITAEEIQAIRDNLLEEVK